MKRKLLIASIIIFVALIIASFFSSPEIKKEIRESIASTLSMPSTNKPSEIAPSDEKKEKSDEPNPEFVQFLSTEAAQMNSKRDPEQIQKNIENIAEKMTITEMEYAKKVALSTNNTANERILSVYMLMNAKGSEKVLADFISSPLKNRPNAEPHSMDEVSSMQEKAQRIMAIDGLVQRAVKDPEARDTLARLASELQDPTLRSYAQKKLRELPPI